MRFIPSSQAVCQCAECGESIPAGSPAVDNNGERFCSDSCALADPCVPRNLRIQLADLVAGLCRRGQVVRA